MADLWNIMKSSPWGPVHEREDIAITSLCSPQQTRIILETS